MSLLRTITSKELASTLIGHEVPREPFLDSQTRKRKLREQSEAIADRMERCGISGRTGRKPVSIVGMVTGEVDTLPDFRNCNLIPTVHSRNVRDTHRHVDYYISTVPKKQRLRMLVVSGGWVPLSEYRKHHKAHTRRMSKFAAHRKLKEWGIKPVFYNVESTIHRDDEGRAMLNLHSHVLIHCTRYIGKNKWAEYLEFARRFFPKGYAHDSAIQKAAECVKYCFKPSEFELLTDSEFGELVRQIMGERDKVDPQTGEIKSEGPLKFFIPLGALREQRRKLKGQKLVKVPVGDDWQWRVTERQKPEPKQDTGTRSENVVLAVTRPIPIFTPRMEPCILVQGYTGDFAGMVRQAGLEETVDRAKALYADRVQRDEQAQGAAAYMKHTTTTTVLTEMAMNDYSLPPPDNPPPDHSVI